MCSLNDDKLASNAQLKLLQNYRTNFQKLLKIIEANEQIFFPS